MGKILDYYVDHIFTMDQEKLVELCLEEIAPVRYLLNHDDRYMGATDDQLRSLSIFMSQNIENYKHRIPIIQAVTGNPKYVSTSMMTLGAVSILIDTFTDKDEKGHFIPSDFWLDLIPPLEYLITGWGDVCPEPFWQPTI